jgi:hypothetical protein
LDLSQQEYCGSDFGMQKSNIAIYGTGPAAARFQALGSISIIFTKLTLQSEVSM